MNAMRHISNGMSKTVDWICILEETTRTVLDQLMQHLEHEKEDIHEKMLGRGLYDRTLSIIHHFYGARDGVDYRTFAFPDFDAGFCLNKLLVQKLAQDDMQQMWSLNPNFQIDPKHELMKFIFEKVGVEMTVSKHFCGGNWHREQKHCFTKSPKGSHKKVYLHFTNITV